MTAKSPEEHAENWDLRHEDFKDNDFLYDVYSVMRRNSPFAHTDTPFLGVTPGGAWVATRYEECYRIAQDWQHFSSNPTPENAEARMAAWGGLYKHLHEAVSARTTQAPRDDMIDVLLTADIDGEKLPFQDVVANAMLLVQAGLETTASAMSFAFHYLATHPEERDRLIAQPEILPRAVEEFIRFAGSIHGLHRTVTKAVELSGHTFCPGESVLVNYASANRDVQQFGEPDRCILDRKANRHLGFGAGVHRCLVSNLARLEFTVGLEQVLMRMPDYAPAA